jgi:hypothetical protein
MKGQAYTFIVMLIVIPVFLFITGFLASTRDITIQRADRIIADQMSQVARNVEDDFERAVQTVGRRALLAETNYVLLTGSPVDDAAFRMEELMINGSLFGNVSVIMFNNTLPYWRQKILSTDTGFERDIYYYKLEISNLDGFNILVSLNLDINLSHPFSVSRISKTVIKNISVSVEGLEDPLYILNSGGNVQRQIVRYPFKLFALSLFAGERTGNCTGPASFGGGSGILVTQNASNVSLAGYSGSVSETADIPSISCYSAGNPDGVGIINRTIQEQNYSDLYLDEMTGVWLLPINGGLQYYNMFSSSGPDFLARLEGRLDPSVNGLESFVMDATGIPYKPEQSRLDYQYFSNSTVQGKKVRGLPAWFRIDPAKAGKYNLTGLLE